MTPDRWEEIGKLYKAAADLAPDEQLAFLDRSCGEDRALRREVTGLLAAGGRAGSFLAAGAMADAARMLAKEGGPSLIGKRVGHYQVLSFLGAGGMGEVYRARDARLGREVALKVLGAGSSHDPDRLRRFELEARAAGSLTHPNVLVVHDIGMHEELSFIVSELLEGETLRAALQRGAQSVKRAMDLAAQIAQGLAAAHGKGIVHRDLKPENLFVGKNDRVKILDFGLAKLTSSLLTQDAEGAVKTASGAILGTAGYMSPEQVRGDEADHRTDIFALGAVLYELVTGRRAFHGASTVETLNAILKEQPLELEGHSDTIPPPLQLLIRHCLEKRPEERFQSTHDLALSLLAISMPTATPAVPKPAARQKWITRAGPALLVALACGAGLWALARRYLESATETGSVVRFSVPPPEQAGFMMLPPMFHSMAVSPDGQEMAFVAETEGKSVLWIRSFDALAARALAGTEGAVSPFWSTDSRQLGFFADGKLKKVAASGGVPTILCEAGRNAGSATWNREGTILFTSSARPEDNVAIYRVSEAGGEPTPITTHPPAINEGLHVWPYFLPDGRHFLYVECNEKAILQPGSVHINIQALGSNETRHLIEANSRVAFAQGYLLYVREGVLLAHPFDAHEFRLTGEPHPLVERVSYFASGGYANFSVSENGVLVYGAGEDVSRLAWFNRGGAEVGKVGESADYQAVRLAPDGRQFIATIADRRLGTTDLWLNDLARDTATRFTTDPRAEISPVWSPDGRRVIFAADRGAPPFLHSKDLNEGGEGRAIIMPGGPQQAVDWSPDGRFVLFTTVDGANGMDLWLLDLDGDRKPFPWLNTRFEESGGRFSPDGRWIAFVSDEAGRRDIYVQQFRGEGGKRRISTAGGDLPRWRRDGKELFYLAPDNALMAVTVELDSGPEVGTPVSLFKTRPSQHAAYDVTADGQRFLVGTAVTKSASVPLTVVINWASELRR